MKVAYSSLFILELACTEYMQVNSRIDYMLKHEACVEMKARKLKISSYLSTLYAECNVTILRQYIIDIDGMR